MSGSILPPLRAALPLRLPSVSRVLRERVRRHVPAAEGPGGCPDENGSFANCWDEGGYCCSDGEWRADPGDGSGNCRDAGLEDSEACVVSASEPASSGGPSGVSAPAVSEPNRTIACPDGRDAVPHTFCGRGPNRTRCADDEHCYVHPADHFAVCCPGKVGGGDDGGGNGGNSSSHCSGMDKKPCMKDPRCELSDDGRCVDKPDGGAGQDGGGNGGGGGGGGVPHDGRCTGMDKKRCRKDPACDFSSDGVCGPKPADGTAAAVDGGGVDNGGLDVGVGGGGDPILSDDGDPCTRITEKNKCKKTPNCRYNKALGYCHTRRQQRKQPKGEKKPEGGDAPPQDEARPAKYWPGAAEEGTSAGIHECFHSADYPDGYPELHTPDFPLLFDTYEECCDAFPCAAHDPSPEDAMPAKYWPAPALEGSSVGVYDCVYSADYPESYAYLRMQILFDTHEECCAAFPCVGGDAPDHPDMMDRPNAPVDDLVSILDAVGPGSPVEICNPFERCYEAKSTCAVGKETCCGITHNSLECTCEDDGSGRLEYVCMYTEACMYPSCCRAGPPEGKFPPSLGTCDHPGGPCDTGVDDDYCCRDMRGGGTYCSKTGGKAADGEITTPTTTAATTTTATESATLVGDDSAPARQDNHVSYLDDVDPGTPVELCNPSERCYEAGSTCSAGEETCCGVTHNSLECTCLDDGFGLLEYVCMYTEACMYPSCCRAGPPVGALPPANGTCDNPGELCDTSVEEDYCCLDTGGGGTYCSKSGGKEARSEITTPATTTATTTTSTESATFGDDSAPARQDNLVSYSDDVGPGTRVEICSPFERCHEAGSTCSAGEETCCGVTHNSLECTCLDDGYGKLEYACMHTEACMSPSCCRSGPPADLFPPTLGTCDRPGELCDTGIEDDWCCHGGAYCSKSGGKAADGEITTPATATTTTTAAESAAFGTATTTTASATTAAAEPATLGEYSVPATPDDSVFTAATTAATATTATATNAAESATFSGDSTPANQGDSMFKMYQGPCTDSSFCAGGLVCSLPAGECVCDVPTDAGCPPGQSCGIHPGSKCDPEVGCLPSCACNFSSDDTDGGNGCPVGEVCRAPCALAGGGPQCYESDEVRDCEEIYGSGYVCRDTNGDGAIDGLDGASGCVMGESKSIKSSLTEAGSGHIKETSRSSSGDVSLGEPEEATAPPGEEYWWPTTNPDGTRTCVYSDLYPNEYVLEHFKMLMDTKEECCAFYQACSDKPVVVTGPDRAEYWWPTEVDGVRTCVHNSDYPDWYDLYLTLHDTEEECCEYHNACLIAEYWYPHLVEGVGPSCVHGSDYPNQYDINDRTREVFLFEMYEDCCAAYPRGCGAAPETETAAPGADDPKAKGKATGGEAAATAADATATTKAEYWWPVKTHGGEICVHGHKHPEGYQHGRLHRTEEECCKLHRACRTAANVVASHREYWYPRSAAGGGGRPSCVFGSDYPDWLAERERAREALLFEEYDDCCAKYPAGCVDESESETAESPAGATTAESEAKASAAGVELPPSAKNIEPTEAHESAYSTDCEWHIGVDGSNRCTNSGKYPPTWDKMSDDMRRMYFFPTAEACCNVTRFGDDCVVVDECPASGGGIAAKRNFAPPSGCEWHIDVREHLVCTNSMDYPTEWEAHRDVHFFATAKECCENRYAGLECVQIYDCPPIDAEEEEARGGGGAPSDCEWHISTNEHLTCTNSGDYPREWDAHEDRDHFLFATAEECCETRFAGRRCNKVDDCGPRNAVEGKPAKARSGPSSGCEWHIDTDRHDTCTNSRYYPEEWDAHERREHFLFPTAEECCEARFPGRRCAKVNDCAREFLPIEADADLTDLPWDFGDPPRWEIDDSVSVSSEESDALPWDIHWLDERHNVEMRSFDSHSLTNIPAQGTDDGTSDLTLKIRVRAEATLRCLARIDVIMPFERFYVEVNGAPRQQFHVPENGWREIMAGFPAGDYTIVFRVEQNEIAIERPEGLPSGRVWLDQCQIVGNT